MCILKILQLEYSEQLWRRPINRKFWLLKTNAALETLVTRRVLFVKFGVWSKIVKRFIVDKMSRKKKDFNDDRSAELNCVMITEGELYGKSKFPKLVRPI